MAKPDRAREIMDNKDDLAEKLMVENKRLQERVRELEEENKELTRQIYAWQSAFGTAKLSHATEHFCAAEERVRELEEVATELLAIPALRRVLGDNHTSDCKCAKCRLEQVLAGKEGE